MQHIEQNALKLNRHELEFAKNNPEKRDSVLHNIVQVKFPIQYCQEFPNIGFVICCNERFIDTISLYQKCHANKPDCFHTGNSEDILHFLYSASKYPRSFKEYKEYLRTEACCYVVRTVEDTFQEILRIDLYRKEDPYKEDLLEFTGGLFHCLRHFSISGVNLCNRNDIFDVPDIFHIVYKLGCAFVQKFNQADNYINLEGNYILLPFLYRENESKVYFIKSIRKEDKDRYQRRKK